MTRRILAVIIGIVGASVCIFVLDLAGGIIFPPPPGIALRRPEAVAEYVKSMPVAAMAFALAAQAAGALVGGFITALVNFPGRVRGALVCGVILTAFGIVNALGLPHPPWFTLGAIVLPVPLSLIGARVSGVVAGTDAG